MGWKNEEEKALEGTEKRKNGWRTVENTSRQNTQLSFYAFQISSPFRFTPLFF
jgi:hypothetical protein